MVITKYKKPKRKDKPPTKDDMSILQKFGVINLSPSYIDKMLPMLAAVGISVAGMGLLDNYRNKELQGKLDKIMKDNKS
jgi:hypothetical protein